MLMLSAALAYPGQAGSSKKPCPFAAGHKRRLSETDPATFTSLATALLDGTAIDATPGPHESGTLYPHDLMTCSGGAVLTTPFMDEALSRPWLRFHVGSRA